MDLCLRWFFGMVFFSVLVAMSLAEDMRTMQMNNFIKVVETIEAENPGLGPLAVLKGLRKAAGIDTEFIRHYLGPSSDTPELIMQSERTGYMNKMVKHGVLVSGVEEGVVLTTDGITVALTPLLLGLEVGLQATPSGRMRGLYHLTLTKDLVLSILQHSWSESSASVPLGSRGYWNSMSDPQVFTLSDEVSMATEALINGGMDGFILGKHVAKLRNRPQSLSSLLKQYYNHQLDSAGLDAAPRLISQLRRNNFRNMVNFHLLKSQLIRALAAYQKLDKYWKKEVKQKLQGRRVGEILDEGLKTFMHTFVVCPPIISRSTWGAKPFIGTPTYLSLPLKYLFIHHTAQPSKPCLTFDQCASDMRSMQTYHQDTNGWSDIGYSFVVGGEGNLYEGRGWNWQGAHTYGYNSVGYGISFIGDYTSALPTQATMDLVKSQWVSCATGGGRLVSSYVIHGHRQMVSTTCPGNALYNQIRTWAHFAER